MHEVRFLRASLIVGQVPPGERNNAECPARTVVLTQLFSRPMVGILRVRPRNVLLYAPSKSVVGVGRRRAAVNGLEAVFGVPLVSVGTSARPICGQVACRIVAVPTVADLVGQNIEAVIRARTVGLTICNASHVSIAITGKSQIMRRGTRS